MAWKPALMLALAVSTFAQSRLVNSVGNFIHDVGDLDRSVHFYHDVLGLDSPRPPGDWQTTDGILKMYDAVGGKFRVGNAQIPDSPMRVELVEFQGVDRKPVRRPWAAAGTSVLMLTVADLAPVEERLKTANVPLLVKSKKACDGRGIVVADPDGFAVMLVEKGGPANGPSQSKSNFTGMKFGYVVGSDAIATGPFAALGLRAETRTHICQPIESALMNQGGSESIVTLPGGFEIWLFKGKKTAETGAALHPRDPGAGVLRLAVSDVDGAVQALKQARLSVASVGGEIQTLPPAGLRAVILRAPDDLFIQVVK